jgi:hypothetical protein
MLALDRRAARQLIPPLPSVQLVGLGVRSMTSHSRRDPPVETRAHTLL